MGANHILPGPGRGTVRAAKGGGAAAGAGAAWLPLRHALRARHLPGRI